MSFLPGGGVRTHGEDVVPIKRLRLQANTVDCKYVCKPFLLPLTYANELVPPPFEKEIYVWVFTAGI
jgi:hypothetical protein